MKLRRGAILALPFVLAILASRWVAPKWGDWGGKHVGRLADVLLPRPPPPPKPPVPDPEVPPSGEPDPGALEGGEALDASAGARPRASRPKGDAGAPARLGPLRIPAAAVQRAIDDGGKNIRARSARGPDGKPVGVRLTGVSGAGVGLRDGDLIVAVDGTPTMDEDAATDAALAAVARGESVLRVTLVRAGRSVDIAVELPLAPEGKAR